MDIDLSEDVENQFFEEDSLLDYDNTRLHAGANPQAPSVKINSYQPKVQDKFNSKINIRQLPSGATNYLREKERIREQLRYKIKDKSDRATIDSVLDKRSRLIMSKWLNKGLIAEINGTVSTGKEANVYSAQDINGKLFAIKVFQIVNPQFKRRRMYIDGEYRYPQNNVKGTSQKYIRMWAEKEHRNLLRMAAAGITCPQSIDCKSHVILMTFIGKQIDDEIVPAPKLKDLKLNVSEARSIYLDVVIMMWKLYKNAKLIHGDLSEYNILYQDETVYFIDIGQGVMDEHPHAIKLLGMDCHNITNFFRKCGVACMSTIELFTFIIDPAINSDNMMQYLNNMNKIVSEKEFTDEASVNEKVFNSLLTTNLFEMRVKKLLTGDFTSKVFTEKIIDLITNPVSEQGGTVLDEITSGTENLKIDESNQNSEDEQDDSSSGEDEDEVGEKSSKFKNAARPKNESLEEKKARKKAIKDAQAEKRTKKVKKHVKKRLEKVKRS